LTVSLIESSFKAPSFTLRRLLWRDFALGLFPFGFFLRLRFRCSWGGLGPVVLSGLLRARGWIDYFIVGDFKAAWTA
jgi:hypothetical protein